MDNYDKIEELYEIIKEDPSNFQAVRELSVALLDSGFNEEALKQLVYLVGIFPEDARLYFNIGFTFEKLKLFKKAEYSYRKAISLDPDEPDYYYNLGYLLMKDKKHTKEAVECFKKVLEKQPNDPNTFFNLGIIYLKGKNYATASKCFKKAYDLNNFDTLSLFYEGNAQKRLGNSEKAREIYNKVIEISPEYSWAYYNLAQIDWSENNIEGAIMNLEMTLRINPKDIDAAKLLCQIYIKEKEFQKAYEVIRNIQKHFPNNGDLYYFLSKTTPDDTLTQIDNLKKALENYKSLTINSNQIKQELKKLKS